MLKTAVDFIDNKPFINVDGKICSPLAYTTYFDECGEWKDFIAHGYRMFFVNVSFTDLPINNVTGFTPFRTGIFETDIPDYSQFDKIVQSIIGDCPDALIFPRINIAMPRKWIKENPYETVNTPTGSRESLFSEAFKRDGAELLKKLISHIRCADYADRIAGYQLCGGATQEWIHHDLFGSFSEMGMEKFRKWVQLKHGIKDIKVPVKNDFENNLFSEETRLYYQFCSEENTKTIEHFARVTKELISNKQIVGVFYGYNAFVSDPIWGLHGLWNIIDSPYIDFFSSPCCYDCNRDLGVDWGDMLPVDSLRLHNKLCFIECDIRTHLTKSMRDSRPGEYPDNQFYLLEADGKKTVWCGPDTPELSISAIRKAFAHQITKSSGIWWFDMWGGWYHQKEIMDELRNMEIVYDNIKSKSTNNLPSAEVVLFIDEKAYRNIQRGNSLLNSVNNLRVAMGNSGIPFDMIMVEDAPKVLHKYKAAIFTAPRPSAEGKAAVKLCKELSLPHISVEDENIYHSTNDLRAFLVASGVHCYNKDSCVVYCGNGILSIHTVNDTNTKLTLPRKYKIKPLSDATENEFTADEININAPKHSTVIFELS